MTTNPERLWVTCASNGVAIEARGYSSESDARDYREGLCACENTNAFSPVAEYVLASVAAAKEEAARAQSKEGWKSFGEAMALVQAEADEKHALRAEVEALRTLAKRAADLLRPSFRLTVDGRDTPPNALVADIDAALSAKGVG